MNFQNNGYKEMHQNWPQPIMDENNNNQMTHQQAQYSDHSAGRWTVEHSIALYNVNITSREREQVV